MKSITLKADDRLIDTARRIAAAEHTTLDAEFDKWLRRYTEMRATVLETKAERRARADRVMVGLEEISKRVDSGGRKFTREEMNERGDGDASRKMTRGELAIATLRALRKKYPTDGRKFTRDEMNER